MSPKTYTYKRLLECIQRDKAIIDMTVYTPNFNFNSKCIINGICQCGQSFNKMFCVCYENGGLFCKDCVIKNTQEKMKQTLKERTGYEHPTQNPETKEKIRQTLKERTGFEYTMQNSETKEKMKQTLKERTGFEYPSQNPETQEKIKQTLKERTGFEYLLQNPETKEKIRQTLKKRTGYEYAMQNPETKEKMKQTLKERTGFEYPTQNPETQEKIKQTLKEKTGFEHNMQNPETIEKRKQNCLEKTGYEHYFHNPEFIEKCSTNGYKRKEFTMPSGSIRMVQGYEPQSLALLLQTYQEEDIVTEASKVPEIWYITDTKHRHYVDIYIKSTNTCIEVKSTWTYDIEKEKIHFKQQTAKDLGLNYEIWIMNQKGSILEKII